MLTEVDSRQLVAHRLKNMIPSLPPRHPAATIRHMELVIRLFVARSMWVMTMAYRPVGKKKPVMNLKMELMNSTTRLMTISCPKEMKLLSELQTKYMTLSMTSGKVATSEVRVGVLMLLFIRANMRPKFRRYRALRTKATSSSIRVPMVARAAIRLLVDPMLVAPADDATGPSLASRPSRLARGAWYALRVDVAIWCVR